jgi:hypothetical protein
MSCDQSAVLSCQLITGAGKALVRAHALLLHPAPQSLDRACSELAVAVAHVSDLQKILVASPSEDLGDALLGLRREIGQISRLLEHAASYHANLLQSMMAAAASEIPPSACLDNTDAPVRRVSLVA